MDKKRLLPAVLVVFVNLLGATIVMPILPLYAVDRLGGTVLQAVLLDTSYYAAKLVAAPLLGRLSDRFGRRPLLLASQAGTLFSFGLFTLALPLGRLLDNTGLLPGIGGGLLLLYVARLLDGATGGNTIIAQAYVADITDEAHRAQALGYLSAALGVGFVLGPALGGVLAASFGLLAPFLFGAAAAAAGLLTTFLLLEESREPAARAQPASAGARAPAGPGAARWLALRQPEFGRVAGIGFLTTLCFAAISPTFALYVRRVLFEEAAPPELVGRAVGFTFLLVGVVMVVTQGVLIRPLIRSLGERRLLAAVQGMLLLAFLAIPTARHPLSAALLMIPLAFAYSVAEPGLQALITRTGGAQMQGQLLGAYHAILSLAYLLGPLWGGLLFERVAPQALWWGGACLLLPAFLLAARAARPRPARRALPPPA